jgi:hypothetical protein
MARYLAFFLDATSYIVGVIWRGTLYDSRNTSHTLWGSKGGFNNADKSRTLLSTSLAFSSQIHDMTEKTTATVQTIYLYQSTNLIISYSIAILASIAAVILGSYSLYQNGGSYDASISTIATTMQHPEVFRPLLNIYHQS